MECSDEYRGRSRIHGAEDRDGHTNRVLSGRTIGRSADVVCGLHRAREDEERGFLG
jgi:nitrite reductase/ring-hydroxylating ferredoxin subunit